MINLNFLYRGLLIISTLAFLVLWFLPYINYSNFSEYELSLLSENSYKSNLPNSSTVYWGLFFIWVILSIGLFFYNRIARIMFLILIFITSLANFFWGYRVYTPLESGLSNLIAISDGALLALAYLSEIKSKFS